MIPAFFVVFWLLGSSLLMVASDDASYRSSIDFVNEWITDLKRTKHRCDNSIIEHSSVRKQDGKYSLCESRFMSSGNDDDGSSSSSIGMGNKKDDWLWAPLLRTSSDNKKKRDKDDKNSMSSDYFLQVFCHQWRVLGSDSARRRFRNDSSHDIQLFQRIYSCDPTILKYIGYNDMVKMIEQLKQEGEIELAEELTCIKNEWTVIFSPVLE